MNEEKIIIAIFAILIAFCFIIPIYDFVVNEPERQAYCKKLNAKVIFIPQTGSFCKTEDGRLLEIIE